MIEHKHWLQTYSGKGFDLLDPKAEQIDIRDIAHALAIVNRYTGHTYRPYSVAQHSVNVARHAGGWDGANYTRLPEARYGLLHDASEAYLNDIASPLKALLPEYEKLEEKVSLAILLKFGLAGELTEAVEESVRRSDLIMLMTEKRDLMGPSPEDWNIPFEPDLQAIEPKVWRTAETDFLLAFSILFPAFK